MARVDRRPRRRLPIEQRRAAILTAAQQAFAGVSYDKVSLAGIAESAGASEALVHRYFATKADLYVEIVGHAIDDLVERHQAADAAIGGADADQWQRVVAAIETYLDFTAGSGDGWVAPLRSPDPGFSPAFDVRTKARAVHVEALRDALRLEPEAARDYALYGYLGFLDSSVSAWATAGCPDGQRPALVTMALGALSGALGALEAQDD